MEIGFCSHKGQVREHNEDYLLIDGEIGLLLVADGVGGHKAGDVASRLAAQRIHHALKRELTSRSDPVPLLRRALNLAHAEICQASAANPEQAGMGTTVVLALTNGLEHHIAHVGDSRAYLFGSQTHQLLTQDHSLVADMVRLGEITPLEARTHRLRHVITQCLGCQTYSGPEIISFPWPEDQILLLCSDGLTDLLSVEDIQQVMHSYGYNLQMTAEMLVSAANQRGGYDNISLILARLH